MSITSEWLPGADWRQVEVPWREIVAASPHSTAFQSPAWVGSLIDFQMVTGTCGLLLIRKQTELIGVVPMFRRGGGSKVARVLLLGGDYNDAIAAPGFEADVVEGFAQWLAPKTSGVEFADLRSLSPTGVLYTHREHLHAAGWSQVSTDHQPYPAIALPGTYPEYESTLGKGLRRDLKQIPRRMEREHPPFVVRLGTDQDMPEFFRLHQLRWEEKGMGGVFATEAPRVLHTRLAKELGEDLRLWIAEAAGRAIGALYGFAHGSSVIEYLSGYDPEFASMSPVKVLRAQAIQHAIGEGRQRYDFAKGEEDYKVRWLAEDRMTKRILFGKGPRSRFVMTALGLHPHLKALKRRLKGS